MLLILALWLSIAAYVALRKKEILGIVTAQLNENLNGKLTIGSMEPALIRHFPAISVELKNVLLRDSLFKQHKHDLLKAKSFTVRINSFSIFSPSPKIESIEVKDGTIYLFTDSSGYSNSQLFQVDTSSKHRNVTERKLDELDFQNVHLVYEHQKKGKYFDFQIARLRSKFRFTSAGWDAKTSMSMRVGSLSFNVEKGSFIKGKNLNARLKLRYNSPEKSLSVPPQQLKLDSDKFLVGGNFWLSPSDPHFSLNIKTASIRYNNLRTMLFPKAATQLKRYSLQKPIRFEATLAGSLRTGSIPLVKVRWSTSNNRLSFAGETIRNCSFQAAYINEVVPGRPRQDPNSKVSFKNFRGTWEGIPFRADDISVVNLERPVLQGKFHSSFRLPQINNVARSESFNISGGRASLNLIYRAPLNADNSIEPYILGDINIRNGELNYRPRGLFFRNINGLIRFHGEDLSIRDMGLQLGSTSLTMNGSVANFVNLYYRHPEKILLHWNLYSPRLNLPEFLSLLSRRKTYSNTSKSRTRIFRQLDRVLDEASIDLSLNAGQINYRKFRGANLNSEILLNENQIELRKVSLQHAGGSLLVSGTIDQRSPVNQFSIRSRVNDVDVQKLFYAFENFGQQAITSENISGRLSSTTNVRGLMKENGQIVPKSFHGDISFDLRKGSLIRFEPMEKIGSFAFPNRDFSNIKFGRLTNILHIEGNKVIIPEMTIATSVLNLFVKGVYGIPTGTNIALEVPIRNPEKDQALPDSLKEKRMRRGIVLNFTAMNDETGRVKIKFGKHENREEKKEPEPKKTRRTGKQDQHPEEK